MRIISHPKIRKGGVWLRSKDWAKNHWRVEQETFPWVTRDAKSADPEIEGFGVL